VASGGIKLPLLPARETTNSQNSVSTQFHHAAHGYTLSNTAASGGLSVLVREIQGKYDLSLPIEVETGWDDMPVFNYAPDMAYGEDGQRRPNAFTAAEIGLHAEQFHSLFQAYEIYSTLCAQGEKASAIEAHYREQKALVLEAGVQALKARQASAKEAKEAEEIQEAQDAYWAAQAIAWETNAEGIWANKAQEAVWAAEFEREEAQRAAEAEEGVWDDESQEAAWAAQYLREEAHSAFLSAEMAEIAMDYWEHSRTWYD
jgi:hypothetical protein